MQNLQNIDKAIINIAPKTKIELIALLNDLQVKNVRIKDIDFMGYRQGVHVIIDGRKLPLERGHVYSVFS